MLTIATVNVNGIRAAFKRGMGTWLEARKPDVLLLQEVRASDEILADHLPAGEWHLAHEASEAGPGGRRHRVAAADDGGAHRARHRRDGRLRSLGRGRPGAPGARGCAGAHASRSCRPTCTPATLGTPSMDEKYAFLDHVTARLADIAEQGGYAVVAGDVNIAHREADIRNWKGNLKSAGFLPRERAYLDRWFDDLGWHDLGRELGGEGPGPYTWWSWRGQAFDNDAGWRIDYQLATPDLADAAVKRDRRPRGDVRRALLRPRARGGRVRPLTSPVMCANRLTWRHRGRGMGAQVTRRAAVRPAALLVSALVVLAGLVLVPSSAAQADFASQCASPTRTVAAGATSITVGSGEVVLVASDVTAGIDALPAGGTLCVASGATLTGHYMNNAAGAIAVAAGGVLDFPSVVVNAGFSLELEGTADFAGLGVNGTR